MERFLQRHDVVDDSKPEGNPNISGAYRKRTDDDSGSSESCGHGYDYNRSSWRNPLDRRGRPVHGLGPQPNQEIFQRCQTTSKARPNYLAALPRD